MSNHINTPSQAVSLPATPGYWRYRRGWSTLSLDVCLWWDTWVPGSMVLMRHGPEDEAGLPYWHQHSLFTGWKEWVPDEICHLKCCSAILCHLLPADMRSYF